MHTSKKHSKKVINFVFIKKLNNGSKVEDVDIISREQIVKLLDAPKVIRGSHIFQKDRFCRLYFQS